MLHRQQIKQAGATSVAEALRLVPGLFVTEQRNGYFNVAIRGLNALPTGNLAHQASSKRLLLLVNGRPLHDHYLGVTPWHDLSFSIDDIEYIKVSRGANSVAFGSAAVGGVIEVMTRQPEIASEEQPLRAEVQLQDGTSNSRYARFAVDYLPSHTDWAGRLSVNAELRDRHQTTLYSQLTGDYEPIDGDFLAGITVISEPFDTNYFFSDANRAMDHRGLNLQLVFDDEVSQKMWIDVGVNRSEHLKVGYWGYGTPLAEFANDTTHANVRYHVDDLHFQMYMNNNKSRFNDNFSFDAGEIVKSTLVGLKTNYQWQIGEVHHLSVAGAYRFTSFNTEGEVDNMSEPHGSHTASLQLQDSWYYTNRLQLHLAARIEWLDISMKTGVPLQFGAIYRLSDRHRATFLFSQGYQEPYLDVYNRSEAISLENGGEIRNNTNNNLANHQIDLWELGLAGTFWNNLDYEFNLWFQQGEGYFAQIRDDNDRFDIHSTPQDLALRVEQYGMTLSVMHPLGNPSMDRTLHYFVTFQKTKQFDLYRDPFNQGFLQTDIVEEAESLATPRWFGGFVMNWRFLERVNLNVNGYYTDDSELDIAFYEPAVIEPMQILNVRVSFDLPSRWLASLNFRNVNDTNNPEFIYTDSSRDMLLMSIEYQ